MSTSERRGRGRPGGGGGRIKWHAVLIGDKCEDKTQQGEKNVVRLQLQRPQLLAVVAVKNVCASRSQPFCKTSETINTPHPLPTTSQSPPPVGHSPGVVGMSERVALSRTKPTRRSNKTFPGNQQFESRFYLQQSWHFSEQTCS